MRNVTCLVIAASCVVSACRFAISADNAAPTSAPDNRPLVMFVGDSLTVGTKSHPNKEKFPRWSYVEAIRVLADKHGPYRYDKRCGGGQSICGPYSGMLGMVREVTVGGKRGSAPPEKLAAVVFQDSAMGHMPTPEEYEPALRQVVGFVEQRPGVKLILCTTAFERRKEGDKLGPCWAKINEVMLKVAAEKKLGAIRQDVYWQRYIDWYLAKKLPTRDEIKWRLTGNDRFMDTVHPGATGAVFMAMQIGRDLGIPADKLDVSNPDLPIPPEQAGEIRDFVYSWKEPLAIRTPATPDVSTSQPAPDKEKH